MKVEKKSGHPELKIFKNIEILYSWHLLIQTLKRNKNVFKYANVRGIGQCFLLCRVYLLQSPKILRIIYNWNVLVNSMCYYCTDEPWASDQNFCLGLGQGI